MVVVTRDELDTIIAAAVRAGLADIHRRLQLFLGLPVSYAPSLQRHLSALLHQVVQHSPRLIQPEDELLRVADHLLISEHQKF